MKRFCGASVAILFYSLFWGWGPKIAAAKTAAATSFFQYEKSPIYQKVSGFALNGRLSEALKFLQAQKTKLGDNQYQFYLSFILEIAGDYEAAFESFKKIKIPQDDEGYEAHFKRLRTLNVYSQSKQLLLYSNGEIFYQDPVQAVLAADIKEYLERRQSLPPKEMPVLKNSALNNAGQEASPPNIQIHIINSAKLFSLIANRFLLAQGFPILGILLQDAFLFQNRIYIKDPSLTSSRMPWSFILEVLINQLSQNKTNESKNGVSFESFSRQFCMNLQSVSKLQVEYKNIWEQKAWLRQAILGEIKAQFGFTEPKWLNINILFNATMDSLAWREYLFDGVYLGNCAGLSSQGYRNFLAKLKVPQLPHSSEGIFADFFKYAFLSGQQNESNLFFEKRFQNPLIRQIYLMTLLKKEGFSESAQLYYQKLGPFKQLPEVQSLILAPPLKEAVEPKSGQKDSTSNALTGSSAASQPLEWQEAQLKITAGKIDSSLEAQLRYWTIVNPYQLKPRQLWFEFLQKKIPLVSKDPIVSSSEKKKWIKDLHMTKQKVYYLESQEFSTNR